VKPLIIDEEAELELAGSVAFYEERRSGLGLDFHAAAKEAARRIATAPERWPVGKHDTRRYVMSRFPFVIHYIDMPDKLWIVAFAHAKRKPGYWIKRLQSPPR
jgi:toxin ParE1/3/4